MSDFFPYSVAFVLSNETFEKNGQIVSVYENPRTGEVSNWGISLKWLKRIQPTATADDVRAITQQQATNLYRSYFWDICGLGQIADPGIAARVLDLNVNQGVPHGVMLLQQALNTTADGLLGPKTAIACNMMNPDLLYSALIRAATTRYQGIHDAEIGEYGQSVADRNLQQWIIRLQKPLPPYRS